MGTNFNKLWNDPKFIDPSQKAKIDFEVALIGKLIEAIESKRACRTCRLKAARHSPAGKHEGHAANRYFIQDFAAPWVYIGCCPF